MCSCRLQPRKEKARGRHGHHRMLGKGAMTSGSQIPSRSTRDDGKPEQPMEKGYKGGGKHVLAIQDATAEPPPAPYQAPAGKGKGKPKGKGKDKLKGYQGKKSTTQCSMLPGGSNWYAPTVYAAQWAADGKNQFCRNFLTDACPLGSTCPRLHSCAILGPHGPCGKNHFPWDCGFNK